MKLKKLLKEFSVFLTLLFIICLGVLVRTSTLNTPTVLDYDPFWFYRYAKNILENNLRVPKWDYLSFYPPGRPTMPFLGWSYTMVFIFKLLKLLIPTIDFTRTAILSPLFIVALIPIPAFLLGKILTKTNVGGLVVALISVLTPTFIGVSMAGYCDTDAPMVFWFLTSLFLTFLAFEKKTVWSYILAICSNLLFLWNWGGGWLTLILFTAFLPGLMVFRIIETIIHKRKLLVNFSPILSEFKPLFTSFLIISISTNILAYLLGFHTLIPSFFGALVFTGLVGQPLIVNVSVAELQPINPFNLRGFLAIAGRVGIFPTILTLFGIPLLALYKIFKKEKITFEEIFLFLFALSMFYLISRGVRFSLQFSVAAAASSGYVVGQIYKYLRDRKDVITATIFGILVLGFLMFISDAIQLGQTSKGMMIDKNWYDMLDWLKENADKKALVATWWDPGHIIAGYTGLRVHADGAHCPPRLCIPYNHNVRIQDMGRIMSTSNETEAITILKKYKQLTPEQCEEAKKRWPQMPDDACDPVSEIYFIASNDLIGKFTWMNYFGGYRAPIKSSADFLANPGACCASTPKTEPGQVSCGEFAEKGRGVWVWCPWIFSLTDVTQDKEGNPIYVYNYAGSKDLKISLIQKGDKLLPIWINRYLITSITFFYQGQRIDQSFKDYNTTLQKIDGLVWVDPNFRNLIYFAPAIKDSIFVRTFFYDGEGLEHFKLVYSNPEIKLYRVEV